MMVSRVIRAMHLTLWVALLALALLLLAYQLFFGALALVLSPLIFIAAVLGGAFGKIAWGLLAYAALAGALIVVAAIVSIRIGWLLQPGGAHAKGTPTWRRLFPTRRTGDSRVAFLPRPWIAGSVIVGAMLGLAAWFPLADPIVGTVAPVEWAHPEPDSPRVSQSTTDAAVRES